MKKLILVIALSVATFTIQAQESKEVICNMYGEKIEITIMPEMNEVIYNRTGVDIFMPIQTYLVYNDINIVIIEKNETLIVFLLDEANHKCTFRFDNKEKGVGILIKK